MASLKPKVTKPQQQQFIDVPVPDEDTYNARVSLIVHLGVQKRGKTDAGKQLAPVEQVAFFADFVDEKVDYGDNIGEKQYRVMLNKEWERLVSGTTLSGNYPYVEGKGLDFTAPFTFHPRSLATKLANCTGELGVIGGEDNPDNMDIGLLLGKPLRVDFGRVQSKKDAEKFYPRVEAILKKGKGGDDFTALEAEPLIITLDTVTEENAHNLRYSVRRTMNSALDYIGTAAEEVFRKKGWHDDSLVYKADEEVADVPQDTDDAPVQGAKVDVATDYDDDIPF